MAQGLIDLFMEKLRAAEVDNAEAVIGDDPWSCVTYDAAQLMEMVKRISLTCERLRCITHALCLVHVGCFD